MHWCDGLFARGGIPLKITRVVSYFLFHELTGPKFRVGEQESPVA
jgi:hypothetical protein